MNSISNIQELNALMKYAFQLRLERSAKEGAVPTVGIVFGNNEIPSKCQEYLNRLKDSKNLIAQIRTGPITAQVSIVNMDSGHQIFSAEVNYYEAELENFKKDIENRRSAALVLGFKYACDYYIGAGDTKEDYSPITLRAVEVSGLATT